MVVISHSLYRNLMKNRRFGYGKTVRGDKVYHNIEKDNEGLDKMRRRRPPRSYSKYSVNDSDDDDDDNNNNNDDNDSYGLRGLYGDDWDDDDEMEDEPEPEPEPEPRPEGGTEEGEVKTEPIDIIHLPEPDDSSTEPYRDGSDLDEPSLSMSTTPKTLKTYTRTVTLTPKTPKTTPKTPRVNVALTPKNSESTPSRVNVALTPKNSESPFTRKSIDKLTPTIDWVTSIDDVKNKTSDAGPSEIQDSTPKSLSQVLKNKTYDESPSKSQDFTPKNSSESFLPSSPPRPLKKNRAVAKVPPSERKRQLSQKAKEK